MVFIGIDVVEEVKRRGPVFVVEILSSFFVSDMKPNLENEKKKMLMHFKRKKECIMKHTFFSIINLTNKCKTYSHGFIGLKTIHVVGSPKTPWREELEQVNFDWRLHKNNVVGSQAKTVQKHKWTCEWDRHVLKPQRNVYTWVCSVTGIDSACVKLIMFKFRFLPDTVIRIGIKDRQSRYLKLSFPEDSEQPFKLPMDVRWLESFTAGELYNDLWLAYWIFLVWNKVVLKGFGPASLSFFFLF